jgi:hypothetical protein
MKIDLYTRCWNDADMLGFFFRHYDPLVQRYVVFDDGSTDNSVELLRSNPRVEIRTMPAYSDPDSRVASGLFVLENCWKESRGLADWVVVTDIDEHIYHPRIKDYLVDCKRQGVTIIPALGYQMLSDQLPPEGSLLSQSVTKGAPSSVWSKMNIFAPDDVTATNFAVGRHSAIPEGNIVAPDQDELLLLHFKYLGFERIRQRHERTLSRQRKKDLARSWGYQYSWTMEQLRDEWQKIASELVDVSTPGFKPWEAYQGARWWEEYRQVRRGTTNTA